MSYSAPRALAPDIARGLMLLMIAVANVSAYLWGGGADLTGHPTDGTALDRALAACAIVFVDARIYPMFAFLFGYGIVQFRRSRLARGVPARAVSRMLLRRHLWLIAFGFVHALLLFAGDILGAYGLAGLLLVLLLGNSSDRAIRIVLWVLGGLLVLGVVVMSAFALLLSALLGDAFATGLAAGQDPMGGAGSEAFGPETFGAADLGAGIEGFWAAMAARVGIWLLVTPATVIALTVPACMLLGMLAARHAWLEGAVTRVRLAPVAAWGIAIGALGGVPSALHHLGALPFGDGAGVVLVTVSQFAGMFGGVGYAALFALLARGIALPPRSVWSAVASVGRRSLSFYLLQSLVFAPLLSAWGFGLGSRIGTAEAYAIAAGVWVLSLLIAVALDRRGARGPAEVLLRRLTYGSLDRAPSPAGAQSPSAQPPGSQLFADPQPSADAGSGSPSVPAR